MTRRRALPSLAVAVAAAFAPAVGGAGCVRERRLGLDLSERVPECLGALAAVEVTTVLVQAYIAGDGPFAMTPFGPADCVRIDPPATPASWETLVEPFLVRGYVVEDLPVGETSRVLVTFYDERGLEPCCGSGREVLCALSAPITEALWREDAQFVRATSLCEGFEPPSMFGYSECIALARDVASCP